MTIVRIKSPTATHAYFTQSGVTARSSPLTRGTALRRGPPLQVIIIPLGRCSSRVQQQQQLVASCLKAQTVRPCSVLLQTNTNRPN